MGKKKTDRTSRVSKGAGNTNNRKRSAARSGAAFSDRADGGYSASTARANISKKVQVSSLMENGMLEGRIDGNNKGFGFLLFEGGDIFIPREGLNGARHGDTVRVKLDSTAGGRGGFGNRPLGGRGRSGAGDGNKGGGAGGKERRTGQVVEILERGQTLVVGTYHDRGAHSFVVPDSRNFCDILVCGNAKDGDKVVVSFVNDFAVGNNSSDDNKVSSCYAADTTSIKTHRDKVKIGKSVDDSFCDKDDNLSVKVAKNMSDKGKGEGRGNRNAGDRARIVEVIGRGDAEGVDLLSIVRGYGFSENFSRAVLKNADEVCHIAPDDLNGREDFRGEVVFTIDGEDSRDFDDAVSIRRTAAGFVLKVHIADVAHYVRAGQPLDKEAYARGTSVYFPFATIPMLPPALSNEICSLKEGEDRLCLSVVMHIDKSGAVTKHRIVESVINSKARLTYNIVQAMIDVDDEANVGTNADTNIGIYDGNNGASLSASGELCVNNNGKDYADSISDFGTAKQAESAPKITREQLKKYKHVVTPLAAMKELTDILLRKRASRGAIEFETDEPQITMDGYTVVDVKKAKRLFSHRLIEEFMVLTNEVVARHFSEIAAPFVYRVHAAPPTEKVERLSEFLDTLGLALSFKGDVPTPHDYCRLLSSVSADLVAAVSQTALRSMTKAEYHPECKGHFGLSLEYYCHFTSPIRRYPDLLIHRIIKAALHGENLKKFRSGVGTAAIQSSRQERLAEEAEREVNDLLTARFMERFVGEEFDGQVSGITERGIFVSLDNTAEGLVRESSLGGMYTALGYGSAKVGKTLFRMGQRVRVRVVEVKHDKIELELL